MAKLARLQARAQTLAAMRPVKQEIAAERAANLKRAQQQIGFSKAAAAILQGIAPRVQDTYSNAANADAGYARGLSDNVQGAVNQQAQGDNAFLTKMGTPSAGLVKPADVGGTAYGLEGYIPATTLQREGAAFGAAAHMLPGDVLSQGQQSATAALNDNTNVSKLQQELSQIAGSEPGLYSKLLDQYQSQALSRERLSLDAHKAAFDQYATQQRLGQSQERIQIDAQRAAQSTLNENRNFRLELARVGIENKRLQMEAVKNEINLRRGGLTAAEVARDHAIAFGVASQAFHSQDANTGKPISYGEALSTITQKGVPLSIAINALHHAGFQPGVRGTPAAALNNLQKTIAALAFGGGIQNNKQAQTLVALAHQYMGTPYVWGGESPKGFDCSGFAQFLYAKVGISIPRTTYDQWRAGRAVRKGDLQPGDLVFFKGSDSRGGLPGHVGIYIGNGQMIDAPHTGADVRIESVDSFGGYQGARRYGKA